MANKGLAKPRPTSQSVAGALLALSSVHSLSGLISRERIEALNDEQRRVFVEELERARESLSWALHHFDPPGLWEQERGRE